MEILHRKLLSFSLGVIIFGVWIFPNIHAIVGRFPQWRSTNAVTAVLDLSTYNCRQDYTIEILSIDPLIIYLDNFVNDMEVRYLLDREPLFLSSKVAREGSDVVDTATRRSETSFLPVGDPVCNCLASRMRSLLGNIQHEHVEPLQLVKYSNRGDQYQLHTDWSETPRSTTSKDTGSVRLSRRLGSVFVYLEDNCQGGETYFPYVTGVSTTVDDGKYDVTENGKGLLVKPKTGSGIFWNNLHANGSGDIRVTHAGLPVLSGKKVGLNIWSSYLFDLPFVGGASSG
ncbi:2OG-Fe(II) oxygenase family Oxidoreductase [Cordyceps javanica]|uniref:2OG-Fe(II) oxygenase family Oxidoreductase n=1 Tax=Cordyceps javanica TaxID=43265 RepID=A0A545ULP9_9HYPO|nr:2OG-Fe(II) oxygenase family Oxidoreductase [Cordyceps javanica]